MSSTGIGASSGSSASSSIMTRESASSTTSSTAFSKPSSPPPVIRNGLVIPQIRLTPPDTRPEKSIPLPEQDLGTDRLFVPLRTEEIGWEEGGLIWAAKRYCYPTVNLYGGDDDRVIGTYRGGPEGYRFVNITDPAFSLASESRNDTAAAAGSAATPCQKTSSSGSKSAMPRGPAMKAVSKDAEPTLSITTKDTDAPAPCKKEESTPALERTHSSAYSSASSSASTSRQGSFSVDDEFSSGNNTGSTTPAISESPADDTSMAQKLDDALAKVQMDQGEAGCSDKGDETGCERPTQKLARRAGSPLLSSDPVDVPRLSGSFKAQLPDQMLSKTVRLSDNVPAQHFQMYSGRSQAERDPLADHAQLITEAQAGDYAAGWAYEQNICAEHAHDKSLLDAAASPSLQR